MGARIASIFKQSGKPVLVEEFGISNGLFSEDSTVDYLEDIFIISDLYDVADILPYIYGIKGERGAIGVNKLSFFALPLIRFLSLFL
jgi:hypothetical protein